MTSLRKALTDKTAKGSAEDQYVKAVKLLPQVEAELEKLKTGEVTPVIKVPEGYTVMKVEGIRYPEDASARKEAEARAYEIKKSNHFTGILQGFTEKIYRF